MYTAFGWAAMNTEFKPPLRLRNRGKKSSEEHQLSFLQTDTHRPKGKFSVLKSLANQLILSVTYHSKKTTKSLFLFFTTLLTYFTFRKPKILIKQLLALSLRLLKTVASLKFLFVRKLVWGRGKLSRPVSHLAVLTLSLVVFLIGGISSVPTIIYSSEGPSDVIASTMDVLPEVAHPETLLPEDRPRDQEIIYTVVEGDTLSSIGEKFGISVDTIRYANNLTDGDYLKISQELIIPPVTGVRVVVKSGDTVGGLAEKYKVSPQAIVDFNYLEEPFALAVGQVLIIPEGVVPTPPPPAPAPIAPSDSYTSPYAYGYQPGSMAKLTGSGTFRWPTNNRTITQYFSSWHPAIDIGQFSPVSAADSGTVVRAGWWPQGYGNAVQIDHGNGYTTTYAHLSSIGVSVGETVSAGQFIGNMGATGRAWGVHLHFVVQFQGRYINPLSVL